MAGGAVRGGHDGISPAAAPVLPGVGEKELQSVSQPGSCRVSAQSGEDGDLSPAILRNGPHEPGSRYVVQKTRSEISSEAFFSPKTLERCLYRLREAGMLSIARGKVCISKEQLQRMEKFRDDPDSM